MLKKKSSSYRAGVKIQCFGRLRVFFLFMLVHCLFQWWKKWPVGIDVKDHFQLSITAEVVVSQLPYPSCNIQNRLRAGHK